MQDRRAFSVAALYKVNMFLSFVVKVSFWDTEFAEKTTNQNKHGFCGSMEQKPVKIIAPTQEVLWFSILQSDHKIFTF